MSDTATFSVTVGSDFVIKLLNHAGGQLLNIQQQLMELNERQRQPRREVRVCPRGHYYEMHGVPDDESTYSEEECYDMYDGDVSCSNVNCSNYVNNASCTSNAGNPCSSANQQRPSPQRTVEVEISGGVFTPQQKPQVSMADFLSRSQREATSAQSKQETSSSVPKQDTTSTQSKQETSHSDSKANIPKSNNQESKTSLVNDFSQLADTLKKVFEQSSGTKSSGKNPLGQVAKELFSMFGGESSSEKKTPANAKKETKSAPPKKTKVSTESKSEEVPLKVPESVVFDFSSVLPSQPGVDEKSESTGSTEVPLKKSEEVPLKDNSNLDLDDINSKRLYLESKLEELLSKAEKCD